MQVGKLGLELDMVMSCAGDVAGAAGAGADRVDRLVHGGQHDGVLAHAQIVVGAPDGDIARTALGEVLSRRKRAAGPLQIGEHAVAAFLPDGRQRRREPDLVIHYDLPPSSQRNIGRPTRARHE